MKIMLSMVYSDNSKSNLVPQKNIVPITLGFLLKNPQTEIKTTLFCVIALITQNKILTTYVVLFSLYLGLKSSLA